jgi:Tol biopolymer transport system component/DNA-binding winged helix-turn-helix (wHTH) protein
MSREEKEIYEFGPFRLDPVKRRLQRQGEPVLLTPKAFDTLLELVRHSGKTLEKDDLMRKVWPDAVVEENNLNQNISTLRKSLGDSRLQSHYIATVPGFGYRFVAEVRKAAYEELESGPDGNGPGGVEAEGGLAQGRGEESLERLAVEGLERADRRVSGAGNGKGVAARSQRVESVEPVEQSGSVEAFEAVESVSQAEPPVSESPVRSAKGERQVLLLALGLSLVAVAAIFIWVYRFLEPRPTDTIANKIEVTPFTRTGTTGTAAISLDGRYIVYSVREVSRESLWLRQVAASSAQQIIAPSEVLYQGLTFSGDGNHIYFVQAEMNGPGRTLYRMPVLGGLPTKLLDEIDSVITLSPNGSHMAFVRKSKDESVLMIADADGSNQRSLARRPMTDYFKIPDWSPDGKEIACSTGSGEPYDIHNGIVLVRVEDGEQKPVTSKKWAWTRWVEWLADGSGLLITAREQHGTPDQIWHIAYPGGTARRLTSDSKFYLNISLTADSQTLTAVQTELLSDIWVAQDKEYEQARKITFGRGSFDSICYSPDGRIVYSSQASGNVDIWSMNADGSNQKQLTADAGVNMHQAVSPDGRYIVFASNRGGVFNIWRIDSNGGNPVQLTRGGGEKFPHCSPDGKWVVYNCVACNQSHNSLWKVPIEGGEPVQLTAGDGGHPTVSPDGKHIAYFAREESPNGRFRIFVIPFTGGPPEKILDIDKGLEPLPFVHWFPEGQALTYSAARDGVSNIWIQSLESGKARQLTDFKIDGKLQFDWSSEGKHLVFSRRFWTGDLVLLKNFAPGKP